jgi:hypothetical protein
MAIHNAEIVNAENGPSEQRIESNTGDATEEKAK